MTDVLTVRDTARVAELRHEVPLAVSDAVLVAEDLIHSRSDLEA